MKLLEPLDVGPVTLKNRSVSTAHGAFLDFYRPGVAGDQYIAYQERRARGGCGLIILQAMQVHPSSQAGGHYMWERDDILPKFRAMADALHAHGTRTTVQIAHFGAQFRSDGNDDLQALWGFSPMLSPSGWEPSHEMTADEIEEVIEGYVATAKVAVEGGLDGVEIHATHGYLMQQSFSEWGNQRKDEWGTDPLRFLDVVMRRVRDAVGEQALVGLRISAEDWIPWSRGGLGADGLRAVAGHACESGLLDYLNHSEGARSAHYARAIADYYGEPGVFLPLTKGLRDVAGGVPVVGVGKILSPSQAEEALAGGMCDLVGMTRAQIADPDFMVKLERDQTERIRPCVGTNSGCVDRMENSLPITCFHNPDTGREWRLGDLDVTDDPKTVLVVGAGPAGLKAAEIAARRGHRVRIAERGSRAGGRLVHVDKLGEPGAMLGAIDWILTELDLLGVEVEYNTEVDAGVIEAGFGETGGVDVVVLATGAEGVSIDLKSDGSVPLWSVDDAMTTGVSGARVVLLDQLGQEEQSFCAQHLAREGAEVLMVTPFPSSGVNIGFTHIRRHLENLHELGVSMVTSTVVTGISDGELTLRHVYAKTSETRAADALVIGGLRKPNLDLWDAANQHAGRVILAGDVVAPRTAMHAFREGDNAGRAV